jgi:hypothetical protein
MWSIDFPSPAHLENSTPGNDSPAPSQAPDWTPNFGCLTSILVPSFSALVYKYS